MRPSKAFKTVLQKEGLRGLYAGNGVNCIRVFPFSAIVCLVYANLARVCTVLHRKGLNFI